MSLDLEIIIKLLNYMGISVTNNTSPFVWLLCLILLFSEIGVVCLSNIIIYLLILLISENKNLLSKLENRPYLLRILNIYRKTRIAFIITEFIFLYVIFGIII